MAGDTYLLTFDIKHIVYYCNVNYSTITWGYPLSTTIINYDISLQIVEVLYSSMSYY